MGFAFIIPLSARGRRALGGGPRRPRSSPSPSPSRSGGGGVRSAPPPWPIFIGLNVIAGGLRAAADERVLRLQRELLDLRSDELGVIDEIPEPGELGLDGPRPDGMGPWG